MTGRSAVRLARVLREHEVGGSNPLAPNWCIPILFSTGRSAVWLGRSDESERSAVVCI